MKPVISSMDAELGGSFDSLERGLALMQELANSLEQAQTAVLHSDLAEIERHSARQQEICDALRQRDAEASPSGSSAASGDPSRPGRWMQLPEAAVPPWPGSAGPRYRQNWPGWRCELAI